MSQVSPAGWYPNPDDATTMRYWDGDQWTEHARPIADGIDPAQDGKEKRRVPLWVAITAGVAGLLFGMTFGITGNSASASEIAALEEELASAVKASDEAQLELEEAQRDFTDERRELEAVIDEAELSLEEARKLVEEAGAKVEAANERADSAEAQAAAAAAPAEPALQAETPAAPLSSNVYYENCTAARNAGAAPVHSGQPGYGRHLDRDGDGVGCE